MSIPEASAGHRPRTLAELRRSGWTSRPVKQELYDNFLTRLQAGEELYPGIIGYDDTVLPELNIALLHQQFRVGGPGGQR